MSLKSRIRSVVENILIVSLLVACGGASPEIPSAVGSSSPGISPSPTLNATSLPTFTSTPTPTPTPMPVIISARSAVDVAEVSRLGNGVAYDLAVSPDGGALAIAGSLGVWLFDAATLQPLRLLEGHTGAVQSVDWSPDGTRLASAGEDGTVRIWDVVSGHVLHVHMPTRRLRSVSVAWSPDGNRLASLHEGSLYVWDATNGELMRVFQSAIRSPCPQGLAWSPDGSRLASLDEYGWMEVWDVERGRAAYEVRTAASTTAYALAWSPNGQWIATAHLDLVSGQITGQIRLWNAANGAPGYTIGQRYGYFYSLAWSPDSTQLVAPGDNNSILVWDVASGRQRLRLEGHIARVTAVAWSPDGARLVSVGKDGALRAWDASTGQTQQAAEGMFAGPVNSLAWSPDGTRLASGGEDRTVRLWERQTGTSAENWSMEILAGMRSTVNTVTWLPDDQLAAGEGAYIHLWNAEWQRRDIFLQSDLDRMSCSPDGSRCVITWPGSTTIRMVTIATGEIVELREIRAGRVPIAWSPDGRWLAFGNQIWDTLNQRAVVLPGDLSVVHSAAWSPDGRLFATGGSQQGGQNLLYVWNTPEGDGDWESPIVLTGHTDSIAALAWSPGGDLLAAGDASGVIILWAPDIAPQPVRRISGHSAGVRALAWSPDGLQLASGGAEGVIRLWSALPVRPVHSISAPPLHAASGIFPGWSGQPITIANVQTLAPVALLGHGTVRDLSLSPDGVLVAAVGGGRVWLYQAATWQLLSSLPFVSNGEVTAVAWSPDGAHLAATGFIHDLFTGKDAARTVVWDTASWQVQVVLGENEGGISVNAKALDLAWSEDGQWLLTPYGYNLLEWNLATGRVQRAFESRPLDFPDQYSLALTASGERVMVGGRFFGGSGALILWDRATGQALDSAQTCSTPITRIVLSPDNMRVAVVCRDGLQIWSLQDDMLRRETQFVPGFQLEGTTADVAWSPNGRLVLLGGVGENPGGDSMGRVWVLDGTNGQIQQSYTTGHSAVSAVLWLDDGNRFAAIGQDSGLQVFDLTAPSHQTAADPSFSNAVLLGAAWLPNSSSLVTLSEYGAMRVWDVERAEVLYSHQVDVVAADTLAAPTSLVFVLSPDGRYAAVGLDRGIVQVIEVESGQPAGEFSVERRIVSSDGMPVRETSPVDCVAWSPDGRYLAAGAYERVWIWDFQSGNLRLQLERPSAGATGLAWSPNGVHLAAAWNDIRTSQDELLIWNVDRVLEEGASSAPVVGQGREAWIASLSWSPDGNYLAVGGLGYLSIFTQNGGRASRMEASSDHCGIVGSLAWSPDGLLLAAGCSDGGLMIWNADNGELVQAFYYAHTPLLGLSRGVAALAWSPDGRLLASAGADGVVRLWGIVW